MSREFLVNSMREAKLELDQLTGNLSDLERNAEGTPDHWSTKDTIAHLGIWQSRQLDAIARIEKEGALPEYGDIDQANLVIYNQNANKTWPEVWAQLDSAYQAALNRLEQVDEEIFKTPIGEGSTFGRVLIGNTFIHWLDHMIHWYLDHNDQENAERLLDLEMRGLLGYDSSPNTQAVAKYNRACFFVKTCQNDKAVRLLREAFQLRPNLVDWSREDPDLLTLHGYPDYEKLYTEAG